MAFLTMKRLATGRRFGLPALLFADLCGLAAFFDVFPEPPRVVLRIPAPVPKTCPQVVVALGSDRSLWRSLVGRVSSRNPHGRRP
jgi:hypothetical protein